MTQVAAGVYKHADFEDHDGMRSQLTTAMQYLASVHEECYGVDVAAIRRTRRCTLIDPTVVEGWRLDLDGRPVEARPEDYAFAEGLD